MRPSARWRPPSDATLTNAASVGSASVRASKHRLGRVEADAWSSGFQEYSPLAILTALTLRAVFRLGLRQTEGLVGSILRLLGLELRVPDHTTLSRRAGTLEVPRPRPTGEAVHLLVGSTGLRLSGPGEWLIEKHGTNARRAWKKLVWGSRCQAFIAGTPVRYVALRSAAEL